MRRIRAIGSFWYDFIVGDDWRIAVGVVLGLVATTVLAHLAQVSAWWLLPLIVIVGLTVSLLQATHGTRHSD